MSEYFERPGTIIEEVFEHGQKSDECYLVYQDKKLRLSATWYAIVTSLLSPNGLDPGDVDEDRHEVLRNPSTSGRHLQEFISGGSLSVNLTRLRRKIKQCFGNELILPPASKKKALRGLHLWTRQALDDLHERLSNPGSGVVVIKDEFLCEHLFVNKVEVKNHGGDHQSPLHPLHCIITRMASSPTGFKQNSNEFLNACLKKTGKTGIDKRALFVHMSVLRRALEQSVGMTLSRSNAGRSGQDDTVYRLVNGNTVRRPSTHAAYRAVLDVAPVMATRPAAADRLAGPKAQGETKPYELV